MFKNKDDDEEEEVVDDKPTITEQPYSAAYP